MVDIMYFVQRAKANAASPKAGGNVVQSTPDGDRRGAATDGDTKRECEHSGPD